MPKKKRGRNPSRGEPVNAELYRDGINERKSKYDEATAASYGTCIKMWCPYPDPINLVQAKDADGELMFDDDGDQVMTKPPVGPRWVEVPSKFIQELGLDEAKQRVIARKLDQGWSELADMPSPEPAPQPKPNNEASGKKKMAAKKKVSSRSMPDSGENSRPVGETDKE